MAQTGKASVQIVAQQTEPGPKVQSGQVPGQNAAQQTEPEPKVQTAKALVPPMELVPQTALGRKLAVD